jgi:hypothetical protein
MWLQAFDLSDFPRHLGAGCPTRSHALIGSIGHDGSLSANTGGEDTLRVRIAVGFDIAR